MGKEVRRNFAREVKLQYMQGIFVSLNRQYSLLSGGERNEGSTHIPSRCVYQ